MKDSHMLFVLLAILVTPFLPVILKGKCPKCGKRKLESVAPGEGVASPFISYSRCTACATTFMREKSGPLQPLSDEQAADFVKV